MSKVIQLNTDKVEEQEHREQMIKILEELVERAKSGQLENILFAGKLDDEVAHMITGWALCNYREHQLLLSELQLSLTQRMIEINYVTPGE